MTEPKEFPVPPDDLRFLERAARGRSPPRASVTAGRLLAMYVRGSRPRPPRPPVDTSPPRGFAGAVCLTVAVLVLALELIYFISCRPDVRGRRLRARLITPRDVKRLVYLRSATGRGLLARVRA